MQHPLQSLINELTQDEAAELDALIQTWPTQDEEMDYLVKENFDELLKVLKGTPTDSTHTATQSTPKNQGEGEGSEPKTFTFPSPNILELN